MEEEQKFGSDRIVDSLRHVLSKPELENSFRIFLQDILMSLDADQFFILAKGYVMPHDQAENLASMPSGAAIYDALQLTRYGSPKIIYQSWKALCLQKSELSAQLMTLKSCGALPNFSNVDGYLEIGFPGRMVSGIRSVFPGLTGTVYAATTSEKMVDYIESGFPRPYDIHVNLTNYLPLTHYMDTESVSVISCFIGLHHCPESGLDDFVKSIADILKPSGCFLLRDHDIPEDEPAKTDVWALASLAHIAFNVGTKVSGLEESTEIRNFHSLSYWDTLLAKHGLTRDKSIHLLQQKGDPTRNCLVCYIKAKDNHLTEESLDSQNLGEIRPQLQTFMTAVEWHSVRMAQDYATFVNHTPFYMFPFLSQLHGLWLTFGLSLMEAKRYHSWSTLLTSSYFWMSLFIVIFHTFEFVAKAIVSAPIAAFYTADGNAETDTIDVLIANDLGHVVDVVVQSKTVPKGVLLRMPRYRKFCEQVQEMSMSGTRFLRVAGQTQIQVQCTMPHTDKARGELLKQLLGKARLIGCVPGSNKTKKEQLCIVYLNVCVKHLDEVVRHLKSLPNVTLDYIHDF